MQAQDSTRGRATAEIIFIGGQVHTVNVRNDTVEAIAVGDRAIEPTLNAMARAQREFPREGLRHRIEHCAICPPDLQDRVRAQHIVPAMQPAFFCEFGDGYIQHYGRPRADTMFPVRSLIAAGVPVAGSSDAPVTHYAPLFGIEQALTRRTMAGDVCGPDERVDLTTAIRMRTIHGAFASFEKGFKGSSRSARRPPRVAHRPGHLCRRDITARQRGSP